MPMTGESMVDDSMDHSRGGGVGRGTIALLTLGLLGSLIAGLLIWGLGGSVAPTVASEASGCTVHPLRFTVTDDPGEFARQQRFESTINAVPAPGFYDRALDEVATLHAASHAFVVVFVGAGLVDDGRAGLRGLADAATRTKAPVIVSQRRQTDAIVALSRGYALTCARGGAAQAAEARRFAAQEYASVADPADRSGRAPAPSTPHEAPSPVDG